MTFESTPPTTVFAKDFEVTAIMRRVAPIGEMASGAISPM